RKGDAQAARRSDRADVTPGDTQGVGRRGCSLEDQRPPHQRPRIVSAPSGCDQGQRSGVTGNGSDDERRRRVLVVDDEPLIGQVLLRILRSDYDVSVPKSSTEALARILGGERYDVILCDLLMPRLTGME